MTLTKAKIVDGLSERLGTGKSEAKFLVETLIEEIKNVLVSGESLTLYRFGKFEVKDKKARKGRIPSKKNSVIIIDARRVVTFKPSVILREELKK